MSTIDCFGGVWQGRDALEKWGECVVRRSVSAATPHLSRIQSFRASELQSFRGSELRRLAYTISCDNHR
jgi:hypothetical protein